MPNRPDSIGKAGFSAIAALIFLSFSPVDEPYGYEVAVIGGAIFFSLAGYFLIRNHMDQNDA